MREVHIGQVVRAAAAVGRPAWEGRSVNSDALPAAVIRLFNLLQERQIPYVLVGGIAMLSYVSGRNTEHIDLIVDRGDLQRPPELAVTDSNDTFGRAMIDGLRIDLLFTQHNLFRYVQQHHTEQRRFEELLASCATVEGMILLKLFALPSLYSQREFTRVGMYENDVATLIQEYKPNMPPLLAELTNHLSETDMAAINDVLVDVRSRIERFNRNQ